MYRLGENILLVGLTYDQIQTDAFVWILLNGIRSIVRQVYSPTARLIGNILEYVMCVGFLNFTYFLSNSRTKH